MVGVDRVYHLAGDEWRGARGDLLETDIQGTQAVALAAADAGVERLFFLSHLGADRASAYPVLKAKAIAEDHVRKSGVDFTIFRSALVFGPQDGFTTGLARLLQALPFIFLLPGSGDTQIQPLWVDDLVTCMVWALEDGTTRNQSYELGGPEQMSFVDVLRLIMETTGVQRTLVETRPPYLRALTVFLETLLPGLPVSVYWLDYLATNRTCALDTIPRAFGLMPSRIAHRLDYLRERDWRAALWRTLWQRRGAR
jgi:NADH dehydrogenase